MQSVIDRKKDDLFDQLLGKINEQFSDISLDFSRYRDDPVGFCRDVLGDKVITPDCARLMEAVVDNRVVHGKSGNSVGKSFSASRIALWFFLTRPHSQVYLTAAPPLANLSSILFGALSTIVNEHPKLFEGFTSKRLYLRRSPASFIMGLTVPSSGTSAEKIARFSGKHAKDGVLMIFDEASAVPDECFSGASTCASDDESRIVAIYNPHYRSGSCYLAEKEGRAKVIELSALRHPQVIENREDITPGTVTSNVTLLRINTMTRLLQDGELQDSSCFEPPDYLIGRTCVDEKGELLPPLEAGVRKIIVPAFATIVLGQYPPATDDQLISHDWIDKARSRWDSYVAEYGEVPPSYTSAIAGCDISEFGADYNSLSLRYGNYVPRLITWQGMDVLASGDRIAEILKPLKVSRVCVDGTGLGSGTAAHLARLNTPAISVKVASSPTQKTELGEFGILRDELLWKTREWLRVDQAMLPPDPQLIEELVVPTYSVDRGKIRIMPKPDIKKLLRRSPDRMDSLALTFYNSGPFAGADLS